MLQWFDKTIFRWQIKSQMCQPVRTGTLFVALYGTGPCLINCDNIDVFDRKGSIEFVVNRDGIELPIFALNQIKGKHNSVVSQTKGSE